jgi:hypothetical protein
MDQKRDILLFFIRKSPFRSVLDQPMIDVSFDAYFEKYVSVEFSLSTTWHVSIVQLMPALHIKKTFDFTDQLLVVVILTSSLNYIIYMEIKLPYSWRWSSIIKEEHRSELHEGSLKSPDLPAGWGTLVWLNSLNAALITWIQDNLYHSCGLRFIGVKTTIWRHSISDPDHVHEEWK